MFVSASDLHIREEFSATLPNVKGDAYDSWEQIYNYAIAEKATGLVLAGDIFDGPPSARDVSKFLWGVHRLREAGIQIYAVQGQHGRSKYPWTSIDPTGTVVDLTLTESSYCIEPGVFVSGYDTLPPEELKTRLSKRKKKDNTNVMVLHQLARGCLPEIEGQQTWDYDPEWMPKGVKLALLGDYHDRWETTTNDGKTFQIYHGSTWMRAINERPDKRFLRVDFDGKNFKTTSIELRTRAFIDARAEVEASVPELLGKITDAAEGALIKVTYDPDVDDVEKQCREAAKDRDIHFYFKVLSKTAISATTYDVEALREISLSGCLDAMVDRETDALFHSFMTALLAPGAKPEDVVESFKAQLLSPTK